ncbi:hypothetical protein Q31a_62290 [Aureliella helgolandensis]|uniref:Uncharacterized protein n=1 Tax=Aureliella helgolandensis TaxID=2527968 RepID=A0A518GGW1_9BACT|nr:hypothetical protein Q31a_62290 [Aureliella helgolandensis]
MRAIPRWFLSRECICLGQAVWGRYSASGRMESFARLIYNFSSIEAPTTSLAAEKFQLPSRRAQQSSVLRRGSESGGTKNWESSCPKRKKLSCYSYY